jgi:hypothetical protein
MNAKASEVTARMGRSLTPPPPPPAETRQSEPARTKATVRTTERFTVDLTPDLNDALARWATERKRTVGRRIPKTEVARVLIELLLDDPSLSTQVEERLRTQPSPRAEA